MKNSLGNPLVISAIASTPQGQKAIGNAIDKVASSSTSGLVIVKNILWIGIFASLGFWAYRRFINGFTRIPFNTSQPAPKISDATAQAKADSIYRAMYGAGNGFSTVKSNLQSLNYNDFIKIHNAFGERSGILPMSKKMTIIEWFVDQFDSSELAQLRFLVPNFF